MKINNISEFYNYIKSKETLSSNSSLMQICVCVDQFKNICSCKQKEKGQKLFECNNQYASIIRNLDQDSINQLIESTNDKVIELYDNSIFIRTISV